MIHHQNEAFANEITTMGHIRAFRNCDSSREGDPAVPIPHEEHIYDWMRQKCRASRGEELPGMVNYAVLENLFREQTAEWRIISERHLAVIERCVYDFNARIWEDVNVEDRVRGTIGAHNAENTRVAAAGASRQLKLLLKDETNGILQTANRSFADTLSSTRQDRVLTRLQQMGVRDGDQVNLRRILRAVHVSEEDAAVYDLHDILRAYYKAAIKRFTENVVIQCVERFFLGDGGSVKSITPTYIAELTDEAVTDIAAETNATLNARTETAQRLERMEKALGIAMAGRI